MYYYKIVGSSSDSLPQVYLSMCTVCGHSLVYYFIVYYIYTTYIYILFVAVRVYDFSTIRVYYFTTTVVLIVCTTVLLLCNTLVQYYCSSIRVYYCTVIVYSYYFSICTLLRYMYCLWQFVCTTPTIVLVCTYYYCSVIYFTTMSNYFTMYKIVGVQIFFPKQTFRLLSYIVLPLYCV